MKKAFLTQILPLFVVALVVSLPFESRAQNREKFIISAQAGGVNAVTGGATMRAHGNSEWQQLTIKEDLEAGDVVRTGLDGRVEMLLNPGSYMRVGENSEFELADNSLDNLEVRLVRGTAIVEVTGADDTELLINITTPHTRIAIVRRGLYRVNVVPGNATELIVRKGRVMLDGFHTKVKGGNKVVFSSGSFSVAKLEKADKQKLDTLEDWSKDRAHTLAKANSRVSGRALNGLVASFRNDWAIFSSLGRSGIWVYDAGSTCYTFLPFFSGFTSPYGGGWYTRSFYPGVGSCCGRSIYDRRTVPGPSGTGVGTPSGPVVGSSGSPINNPTIERNPNPMMSGRHKDLTSDDPHLRNAPPLL